MIEMNKKGINISMNLSPTQLTFFCYSQGNAKKVAILWMDPHNIKVLNKMSILVMSGCMRHKSITTAPARKNKVLGLPGLAWAGCPGKTGP